MDRIFIQDLAVRCIIGIYPEERREKQDLTINIEMLADLCPAGTSDALEDTVDYKAVKKAVLHLAESSSFKLIEALAERVAGVVLADERVEQAIVKIEKPGALRFARASAVEIARRRGPGPLDGDKDVQPVAGSGASVASLAPPGKEDVRGGA